jgi:hypothetical protein
MSKHITISPQEAADRFASSSKPMRTAPIVAMRMARCLSLPKTRTSWFI